MTEKQKTVKLEINLQDRDVPIYTDFRNIEKGYAFLFGTNTKNIRTFFGFFVSFGKIMDKNESEVDYGPQADEKVVMNVISKMKKLPTNSSIWLLGEYKPNKLSVRDCGTKEKFPYTILE